MNWKKLGITLALTATTACSSGSSGGGGLAAPTALVYPFNPAVYTQGFLAADNVPSVTGVVASYSVAPALPTGMTFSTVDGTIGGTPLLPMVATDYTVTATNAAGSIALLVNITVAVPAPRAAYVANTADSTVTSFLLGSLLHSGYNVSSGSGARAMAATPDGAFLYLANNVSGDVAAYSTNPLSGRLTEIGTAVTAGPLPAAMAVDPTSSFAYTANSGDGTVSVFTIGATGALTAGAAATTGTAPSALLVDPTGQFLYVANGGSDDVEVFSIHPTTGELTSGGVVAAGDDPQGLAIASTTSGSYLYVANSGVTSDINQYSINPADGTLTGLVPPAIGTGAGAQDLAAHADGTFLYCANQDDDTIGMFSIDQGTGLLSVLAPGTIGTGNGPGALAIDPNGASLYACTEVTTRENLEPYEQDGGYSFPHEVLLGSATKS